jgi:hypothetical protein
MDEQLAVFKCPKCGTRYLTTANTTPRKKLCITCRRKQGLLNQQSKRLRKELERLLQGKELSKNHKKGILLEYAVSKTLDGLGIPHEHNPFDITYPCFQEENPDIIIKALDTVIECKNLGRSETDKLNCGWLNQNVVERKKVNSFGEKIVVFSHKPESSLKEYLESRGWRAYAVGNQILTVRQAHDAIPRLRQQLCWLREKMKAREHLSSYATN